MSNYKDHGMTINRFKKGRVKSGQLKKLTDIGSVRFWRKFGSILFSSCAIFLSLSLLKICSELNHTEIDKKIEKYIQKYNICVLCELLLIFYIYL